MVINAKCNDCKEPTKYVVGFFDGFFQKRLKKQDGSLVL